MKLNLDELLIKRDEHIFQAILYQEQIDKLTNENTVIQIIKKV